MNPFNNLDQKQIDEDEDLVKLSTESDFVTNSTFTYKIGEYTDKLGEKRKPYLLIQNIMERLVKSHLMIYGYGFLRIHKMVNIWQKHYMTRLLSFRIN